MFLYKNRGIDNIISLIICNYTGKQWGDMSLNFAINLVKFYTICSRKHFSVKVSQGVHFLMTSNPRLFFLKTIALYALENFQLINVTIIQFISINAPTLNTNKNHYAYRPKYKHTEPNEAINKALLNMFKALLPQVKATKIVL